MEPTSEKRFRFRLSLKGLLGATTFLAAVMAGMLRYNLYPEEKAMVIAWALTTVGGVVLAGVGLRRAMLVGLLCGAAGSCLPAITWYATRGIRPDSWIETFAYPILALTVVGSIAGVAVGLAAWLCGSLRRLAMAGVTCAAVALAAYGWSSLAYWHPLYVLRLDQTPITLALSTDGDLMAIGGLTAELWAVRSSRRLWKRLAQSGSVDARSVAVMHVFACDSRYLIAGTWGNKALWVLAIEDGHETATLPIPMTSVRSCRFVANDRLVVAWIEDHCLKIGTWDTRTWQRTELVEIPGVAQNATISSDLEVIASRDSQGIQMNRRGETGVHFSVPAQFDFGEPIFSPNAQWLAADGRIWKVATGEAQEYGDLIVGFSADSALVITLSRRQLGAWFRDLPRSIRQAPLLPFIPALNEQFQLTTWDISSGKVISQSPWLDGDLGAIQCSDNAGFVALSIGKGRVLIWRIPDRP